MTDALNPDAITMRCAAAHLGGDVRRSWRDVPGMVAAEAKLAAVLKACDDADAHDPGHGHWISTRVIREAAQNG